MTPSSRSYYSYYSSSSTKEEEEDDTTVPLHLLPNSLQFQRIHDDQNNKNNHHNTTTTTTTSTGGGSIHVTVRTDPLPLEEEDNSINIIIPKQQAQAQQQHQPPKKTTTSSSSSSSSFTPTSSSSFTPPSSVIPDSVLQYQRQLRKVQANQRSLRPLTRCQHLRIVWEDEHLIVLNKPSGVLCVPGLNNKPNLLYLVRDYLLEQQQQQQDRPLQQQTLINEEEPSKMIVHRLDMDTSGIVVFAKTEPAMKELQSKFRNHDLTKIYHALLCGHLLQSPRPPPSKDDCFDNNNDKIDDNNVHHQRQQQQRQQQQHYPIPIHIHLPLQRDPVRPPFMRVATPRSERYVRQVLPQLQSHGFQKLVLKRPKPSHTELRILRREYIPKTDADDTVGTILSQPQQQQQQRQQTAKEEESENVDYDNDNDDTLSLLLPVTRVELIPHTGRTHQLRVHTAALGHAIVGDPAYGMYGEATPNGGVDTYHHHNNSTATDDDEYYFSPIGLGGGASIELQQQIWEAWSARGSAGSTISTATTTNNNIKDNDNNDNDDNSSNNDDHVRPMCLHAARLTMEHPITGQTMVWEAPTPF